jgi:hypothetical protein
LDRRGRPIQVGICCSDKLRARVGFSIYYSGKDIPAAALASITTRGQA